MLLTQSRRPARWDDQGHLVALETQDRTRWSQVVIHEGLPLVEQALRKGPAGPFAIQAAIGALHIRAPDFASTDWPQIVALYDLLIKRQRNPVLQVNRAAALSYAHSPKAGLQALEQLGCQLDHYQPFHAADLLARANHPAQARTAYLCAIALCHSPQDAYLLQTRLDTLPP